MDAIERLNILIKVATDKEMEKQLAEVQSEYDYQSDEDDSDW